MFRVLITLGAMFLTGAAGQDVPGPRQPEPGEGVICAWAIYSLILEVSERCDPVADPETLAGLRDAVARIDAYVRANSDFTETEIAEFKREQAGVGRPVEQLCGAEGMEFASAVRSLPAEELRSSVDDLVARPGAPTWGTCL